MPGSERGKNWILASTSVAVTLLAMEFGVRLARGKLTDTTLLSAEYHLRGSEQPRAQYDPLLGWVPNLGRRKEGGATYTILPGNVRSNGAGAEPSGRPSVLVVGDSFAFGEEVDDALTWPAQLERRSGHRVINGAVFNYGLDQIVLRSELLVERYEPEVLIVGFIPDDILRCAQAVRLQPKPYFLLETRSPSAAGAGAERALALHNVPVPLLEGDQKQRSMDALRRHLGYSHAVDFVMRRLNPSYWLDPRIVLIKNAGMEDVGNSDPVEVAAALMKRLALLRAGRPRLRILVIAQHERHLWEDQVAMTGRVLSAAAGAGLAVLDTYVPLARLRDSDEARFRSFFTNHMTAGGNEWIAALLEPRLKDLLASSGHSGPPRR